MPDSGDSLILACPHCGGLVDVAYDWGRLAPPRALRDFEAKWADRANPLSFSGVWRFRELLPFADDPSQIVTLNEGNTPLYDAPRSAHYAGLERLRFKHQGMNPTGSFKYNGITTGVTQAVRLGATAVACASTGNTSASMAAYAARAGLGFSTKLFTRRALPAGLPGTM